MESYNLDCLEVMRGFKDNQFDLLLADPPYGIGMSKAAGKSKKTKDKQWDDSAPSQEAFNEMMRISKNQIIFGANHFIDKIPHPSPCWIVWDKRCGVVPPRTFADCELAWTSFNKPARIARFLWDGFLVDGDAKMLKRIHPTQKPVEIYEWILEHYTDPGASVFDPYGGSFSSAIAAHHKGRKMTICELDKEYYDNGLARYDNETAQLKMF